MGIQSVVMHHSGGRKTILIVEDEPGLAILQMRVLDRHGFQPVLAYSGEEAVESVSSGTLPDLVLMDIRLGAGMDGLEAGKKIRAMADLPLVFVSSSNDPHMVSQAEALSPFGFMVKGAGETALVSTIRMALRFQETRKELKRRENSCLKECAAHKPLSPASFHRHFAVAPESTVAATAFAVPGLALPGSESGRAVVNTSGSPELQLDELRHRVKNTFSMLLGMVGMEESTHENREIKGVLGDLGCRIRAFSCLFDLLWTTRDLPSLDKYLSVLATTLVEACAHQGSVVTLDTRMETIWCDHAVNLNFGIILTEVMMNCFKHGFSGGRGGKLVVQLAGSDGALELNIHNDGIVPPRGSKKDRKRQPVGFGLSMVKQLAAQMGGETRLSFETGTLFTLRVPLPAGTRLTEARA